MSSCWPLNEMFELMEGIYIIKRHGKFFGLKPFFIEFVECLNPPGINFLNWKMTKEGIYPRPVKKFGIWLYFFMTVMGYWDLLRDLNMSLDETVASARFLALLSQFGLENPEAYNIIAQMRERSNPYHHSDGGKLMNDYWLLSEIFEFARARNF